MALILRNGGTYIMECLVTLTVEGGNITVEYSRLVSSVDKLEMKSEYRIILEL